MADIRAFRAFRYDLGRVGALADVVAPPYDVIDDVQRQRLGEVSPYQSALVELPDNDDVESCRVKSLCLLEDDTHVLVLCYAT